MYTNMAAVVLMVQLAFAHKSILDMLPEDMMAFINASLHSDTTISDIEVEVLDMSWQWTMKPLPEKKVVLCYAVNTTASNVSMRNQREAYQALENKYLELQKEMELNEIASTAADSVLPKTTTKS